MGDSSATRESPPRHDDHAASASTIETNSDARALLDRLASTEGLTPGTVAALLHNCSSESMRNSILAEVGARWGNSGVQQTLAAERQLTSSDVSAGTHASAQAGQAAKRHGAHSPSAAAATDSDWSAAQMALQVAADVIQHERQQMISQAPSRYAPSLSLLYSAVTGRGHDGKLS